MQEVGGSIPPSSTTMNLPVGVPITETYFPKSDVEFDEIVAKASNYPYVIKPLVAHTWRLAAMKKVSKGKKGVARWYGRRTEAGLLRAHENTSDADRIRLLRQYRFLSGFRCR
jgi:hypothetical protein